MHKSYTGQKEKRCAEKIQGIADDKRARPHVGEKEGVIHESNLSNGRRLSGSDFNGLRGVG
jgi:hypothetical protein